MTADAPSAAELPIEDYLERLRNISKYRGQDYGRVHFIFDAEDTHANTIPRKFNGYLTLSDAFKNFFLETVELLNTEARPKVKEPATEFFNFFVAKLTNYFLALCGAERISLRGYPYQGYSLLRNIYDNLVLTSAVLQGMSDFYSIEGIERDQKEIDPDVVRKRRKKAEQEVRLRMTGAKSALSAESQKEIEFWDSMFDLETHGARLSGTKAMEFLRGQARLSVLPTYEEKGFVLYMNRYCEIAWMLHRLLPNPT